MSEILHEESIKMETIRELINNACNTEKTKRLGLLIEIKESLFNSNIIYNIEWRQLRKRFSRIDLTSITSREYEDLMYYIIYVKDELKFRNDLYKYLPCI